MPKAKTRRRSSQGNHPLRTYTAPATHQGTEQTVRSVSPPTKRALPERPLQNLVMSAMVAIGCLGFAFTFIVFSNDPNRYIFGGMAALMAVMWFVSFGMRLRKWQQKR